jgi:hypothetical protein
MSAARSADAVCTARGNTRSRRSKAEVTRPGITTSRSGSSGAPNRMGTLTERVFAECPWDKEKHAEIFCYECHELLLHNPVLLPEDVKRFSALVRKRGLFEDEKPDDYARIAGRITLFHEVIERGLFALEKEEREWVQPTI